MGMGFVLTYKIIRDLFSGIKEMIFNRSLRGAAGPIMILSHGASSARQGFIPLLMFLALISIGLAVMNILPIGALDGGQILFVTIETVIRRKIPDIIKISINLASWALFIALALFLSYREIGMLFGDKIAWLYQKTIGLFR